MSVRKFPFQFPVIVFVFLVVAMAGRELPRATAFLNTGATAGVTAATSKRTSSARVTRARQVDPYLRRAYEKGGMYESLKPEDEMIEQRDQRTKRFWKPDGTATAVISTGSLHYQDTEGNWQDIDPRVTTSSKPEFSLENTTNTFKTYFPAALHRGQGVRVELGGQSITVAVNPSLVLIDGTGETSVIERAKRSEPMAVQNKVTYPRVFGRPPSNRQLPDNCYRDRSKRLQREPRLHAHGRMSHHHGQPKQRSDGCHQYPIWPGEFQRDIRSRGHQVHQHIVAGRPEPFDCRRSFRDAYNFRNVPDHCDRDRPEPVSGQRECELVH
jgi:hypothetical protein